MYVTPKYTCSEKSELKTIGLTWAREVCRPLGPKVDHTTLVYLMLTIKDGALNSTRMKASVLGNNSWERGGINRWCPRQRLRAPWPFSWGLTTPFPQTSMGALILTPQLLPATCSLGIWKAACLSASSSTLGGSENRGSHLGGAVSLWYLSWCRFPGLAVHSRVSTPGGPGTQRLHGFPLTCDSCQLSGWVGRAR